MAKGGYGKGATNKEAMVNNKPRKKFRKFLCISCSSPDIQPIQVLGETGKRRGTFYKCKSCGETNRERKIIDLR